MKTSKPTPFSDRDAAKAHARARREYLNQARQALDRADLDWNSPIPRDVFTAHFADKFADLNLTPGQISALMSVAVCMSIGNLDTMIKLIADALEERGGEG